MKKGLLSILASALLVVGCQNYDDQFTLLENQITALTQTVDGLSQVQSTLATLSGTVNSLSSTVSGLGDEIDTAVAEGLADIQEDITAIEAAVADVASSDAVEDLADAVAASQEDLDELLANSSVFSGDVNINSTATLAAFKSIGSGLAIVNGNVYITTNADMVHADVQAVVDQILTVTKDFTYTSHASTYAETTFNNLSGVQTLTLKQGGGYKAQGLVSATNIVLDDTWKSNVTIVDLRGLTTVTNLSNEGVANGILKFNKATEMHLTSLAKFDGLDLQVKKGGVIDLSALEDKNALETAVGSSYRLSIDGPASFTSTKISDGQITLTNVATVNISGFIGNTVVNAGVENLTLTGAVDFNIDEASDLISANITGALDTDAALTSADTAGPDVIFASADLTTATLAGVIGTVNATSQANLETLTISADLKGKGITVASNGDLTSLVVTGAKIGDVSVTDNSDLESVTFDHTTSLQAAVAATTAPVAAAIAQDKGATVEITGNINMTSLIWKADDVDSLTVTGNTQLATINFDGLKDAGAATTVTVDVSGNALVASAAKDTYNAAVSATVADAGTYTSASGMSTLKTYLDANKAKASANGIKVFFDEIESGTEQLTSVTTPFTDIASLAIDYDSATNIGAVMFIIPGVTKESTFDGAAVPAKTFVTEQEYTSLGNAVGTLDSGEGFELTYASGSTVDFLQTTARTSVADLVSYMNGYDLSAANLSIEAAIDSAKKSVFEVVYTQTSAGITSAGLVSGNGVIAFAFGTDLLTIPVTGGTTTANGIASGLATAINDLGNYSATFVTTGAGQFKSLTVTRNVSGTATRDFSPLAAAIPSINWNIDVAKASTTATLGRNMAALNTASEMSNTYESGRINLPNITPSVRQGIRVTLKTVDGLAFNSAVTILKTTGSGVKAITGADNSVLTELVDGVSIVSATANVSSGTSDATATTYYVSGASAVGTENVQTTGVTASTTNRLGWL